MAKFPTVKRRVASSSKTNIARAQSRQGKSIKLAAKQGRYGPTANSKSGGGFFSKLLSGAKSFIGSGAGQALLSAASFLPIPGISTAIRIGESLINAVPGGEDEDQYPSAAGNDTMTDESMEREARYMERDATPGYQQYLQRRDREYGDDRRSAIENFSLDQPSQRKTQFRRGLINAASAGLGSLSESMGIPREYANQFVSSVSNIGRRAEPSPYGIPYSAQGVPTFNSSEVEYQSEQDPYSLQNRLRSRTYADPYDEL